MSRHDLLTDAKAVIRKQAARLYDEIEDGRNMRAVEARLDHMLFLVRTLFNIRGGEE